MIEIDVAGAHDGGRVLVVDQREQQMLERRIFVVPLVGERERACRACSRLRENERQWAPLDPGLTSFP